MWPKPCRKSRASIALTLLFIAVASLTAFAQGESGSLQGARDSVSKYREEVKAQQAAMAEGLFNEADARGAAARVALQRARTAYEEAGAPASADNEILFEYAEVTRLLGYHDLTGEAMETVVTRDPANAKAWGTLGAAKIKCGPKHEPRGLEALLKAVQLEGDSPAAAPWRVALAELYQAQGLPDFAREQLEKALALATDNAEGVVRLAVLDARAGKIRAANDAIDKLGKAAVPLDSLTRVLLREALDTFERDGGTFDDVAENHAAYAKLLYRASRMPESLLAASRAVQLNPADTATLNFAASVYMQLGNADAARQAYEKSLAVNPEQPTVQEALKRLPPPAAASPAPAAPSTP